MARSNSTVASHYQTPPNRPAPPMHVPAGEFVETIIGWTLRSELSTGVRIIWTSVGSILHALSSTQTWIWVDGRRLCHVRGGDVWTNRWGAPIVQRPGPGLLLAALRPRDGMLVRVSDNYFLVVEGVLVPLQKLAYRHLLARTLRAAEGVEAAVSVPSPPSSPTPPSPPQAEKIAVPTEDSS